MKKKLGLIGAGIMAFTSMLGAAQDVAIPAIASKSVNQSSNQSTPKSDAIKKDIQVAKEIGKVGGMRMFAGYGIPPHIYGQHYVKKGTHKKTNF